MLLICSETTRFFRKLCGLKAGIHYSRGTDSFPLNLVPGKTDCLEKKSNLKGLEVLKKSHTPLKQKENVPWEGGE